MKIIGEKFQIEAERLKAAMPEMVKMHHIEVRQCRDWQLNQL